MNDIEIRVATAEDLPAVAEFRWTVESEQDAPTLDREDFSTRFIAWASGNPGYHCVIATTGTQLVGVAWLAELARVPSPEPIPARRFRAEREPHDHRHRVNLRSTHAHQHRRPLRRTG